MNPSATTLLRRVRRLLGRAASAGAGFTLLEVMIAVAILAITLTVLYGSQSQSLSLAAEAKFNTSAAFLLEQKLAELEAGLVDIVADEGDFGEIYPQFRWQIEVEDAFLSEYEVFDNLATPIQRVTVTVSWADSPYSRSVDYYLQEGR